MGLIIESEKITVMTNLLMIHKAPFIMNITLMQVLDITLTIKLF